MNRYFASVKFVSAEGAVVADRLDGGGRIFVSEKDAALAGELVVSDVIECSLLPGGIGTDILFSRRARVLAAAS